MFRDLLLLATAGSALAAGTERQTIPLFFIGNHGQAPSAVRYMAQGPGLTAYFSTGEVLFRLGDRTVRMCLEGASSAARIESVDRLPGRVNFLNGPQAGWKTDRPIYGGVAYRNLYPGIDMIYDGSTRNLKSEFRVAPRADPSLIRIRYAGARDLRVGADGALVIPLGGSEFREKAPYVYQVKHGVRVEVPSRYDIDADGAVRFLIENYDRSLPLVIDPVVYSTLLGGSGSDNATALAIDAIRAVYIAGLTASYDFPASNSAQGVSGGGNDVFVAKLNPSGSGLLYCTYLGGKGDDRAFGIAIDSAGSAYITGSTTSANFPTRNAQQARLQGSRNAFVVKLNSAGNMPVFSTYLGGTGSDTGTGIALDASGSVYVTGDSTSTNFPTTVYQRTNRGGQDTFVAKLAAAGSPLLFGTYLGGAYEDHSSAIAVNAAGSVYITGSTYSSDFPVAGAMQSHIGGGQDAFVVRFNESCTALIFSTFLGGTGGALGYPESGHAVTLDGQGNAYVAGATSSADFPLLHPVQSQRRGPLDAFVTKLAAAGALVNSTYLGGTGVDAANAISVDGTGSTYIAGQTLSSDLPVADAFQPSIGGQYDAFIAVLAPTGDSISFLSYLGGNGSDTATGLAVDLLGNVYVAGWTQSVNFPVLNGYQTINAGSYGAFVTKFSFSAGPPSPVSVTPSAGSGSSQTFSFLFTSPRGYTSINTVSMIVDTSAAGISSCYLYYVRATNTIYLANDPATAWVAPAVLGSSSTIQNSQCAVTAATSSASGSGNNLTVNLSLSFKAGFVGAKNIYMEIHDGLDSGWHIRGSWTVTAPAGPSAPISVSPSSGSGSSQTFSFVFSSPRGYGAINTVSMIIGTSVASGASTCYLYYVRASNAIYLANDAGSSNWGTPAVLGSTGTVRNSQCSVAGAGSWSTGTGNNLTLHLAMTFSAAYAGAKNVYMEVYDGQDSGWSQKGTWTVPVTLGPTSVTPISGTGASQAFTFRFSDPAGYASIYSTSMIVDTKLTGIGSCYLFYRRDTNTIYLANDPATAWLTPAVLGSQSVVQNSQCAVNAAASSASGSGNVLTVILALSFKSPYAGSRKIYMEVYDISGADSSWVQMGTWTVP